jgi:hypothetical protein
MLRVNQSDTPERNEQIRLVRDIFVKASRVLVWLGEGCQLKKQRHGKNTNWPKKISAGVIYDPVTGNSKPYREITLKRSPYSRAEKL